MPVATHLLYEAVTGEAVPSGDSLCYVCGAESEARPLRLPPAFMSHADCDRRGRSMCAGCEHYFAPGSNYRRAGHRLLTRREFRALHREELDGLLFAAPWPVEPYTLTLAIARHKNIVPWAIVNEAGAEPVIETEEWGRVVWRRADLTPVRDAFRWLYLEAGFGKESILTDEYPYLTQWVKKGGLLASWLDHREVLRQLWPEQYREWTRRYPALLGAGKISA